MWLLCGLFLSCLYVIFIFILRSDLTISSLSNLELNELGDFLAGTFSPLAFLWLVIGYMMQGKELKLNRDALELQARELANSVKAQNDLVEQSKKQIEFEKAKLDEEKERERIRNSPPDLQFNIENIRDSDDQVKYIFHIKNEGGPAKDIDIQFTLVGYNISSYGSYKQKIQSIESISFERLSHESGTKSYNINQLQIDSCELLIIYYEEITGTCERIKKIFNKNENYELILAESH